MKIKAKKNRDVLPSANSFDICFTYLSNIFCVYSQTIAGKFYQINQSIELVMYTRKGSVIFQLKKLNKAQHA